ncbi:MAG TPA: NAD(P)H-hydrate epimerase, partial [Paludibacteraceae bacterium]|nr:NAD(P)H-hydrate epimerase [Paludibacteraceae bacterium]
MKIFNSTAIRQIDAYTIEKNHIKSIELMEVAARSVFEYIIQHYNIEKKIIIFAGQGNNGGDALALARLLHIAGFSIKIITVFLSDNLSDDCETNYKVLLNKNIPIYHYSRYLELNIKE